MNVISQITSRRLSLGLKQKDMTLRIGMNRQQYQRLESAGNPSLETIDLIAKGLDAELLLVPNEVLREVKALIANITQNISSKKSVHTNLSDNPWEDQWE